MALNISKFKTAGTSKPKSETALVPDSKENRDLVDKFIDLKGKEDAIVGALKTVKAELDRKATPVYFDHNAGLQSPVSSVIINGNGDNKAAVVFVKKSKEADPAEITAIIGKEKTDLYFYEKLGIKIDGDKIPVELRQKAVDALYAAMSKLGIADAVEAKVTVTPREEFYSARFTEFTTEINESLDAIAPIQRQCRKK